jgi:hypothetical protein
MNRLQLWWLGLTCHAWRNRRFLLWLALAVPVVTISALRLMNIPDDLRPVLK